MIAQKFKLFLISSGMLLATWGSCNVISLICFGDMRSFFAIARGGDVSVVVETALPQSSDDEWAQVTLNVRNISCSKIQIQGIDGDCDIFCANRFPYEINPLSQEKQAMLLRRVKIVTPLQMGLFIDGVHRTIQCDLPKSILWTGPELDAPETFSILED